MLLQPPGVTIGGLLPPPPPSVPQNPPADGGEGIPPGGETDSRPDIVTVNDEADQPAKVEESSDPANEVNKTNETR